MTHVALVEKKILWGSTYCAIYDIETAKAGLAYMRVDRYNYYNEDRAVVIVEAAKFLAAWRAAGNNAEPVAHENETGWRADYKFDSAEHGFSQGIDNPVPLARVNIDISAKSAKTTIGFTNGITRTLWLLANGATAFPVECHTNEAASLYYAAGIASFPITTVQDLLGFMTWDQLVNQDAVRERAR